jgi:hypothetical protein
MFPWSLSRRNQVSNVRFEAAEHIWQRLATEAAPLGQKAVIERIGKYGSMYEFIVTHVDISTLPHEHHSSNLHQVRVTAQHGDKAHHSRFVLPVAFRSPTTWAETTQLILEQYVGWSGRLPTYMATQQEAEKVIQTIRNVTGYDGLQPEDIWISYSRGSLSFGALSRPGSIAFDRYVEIAQPRKIYELRPMSDDSKKTQTPTEIKAAATQLAQELIGLPVDARRQELETLRAISPGSHAIVVEKLTDISDGATPRDDASAPKPPETVVMPGAEPPKESPGAFKPTPKLEWLPVGKKYRPLPTEEQRRLLDMMALKEDVTIAVGAGSVESIRDDLPPGYVIDEKAADGVYPDGKYQPEVFMNKPWSYGSSVPPPAMPTALPASTPEPAPAPAPDAGGTWALARFVSEAIRVIVALWRKWRGR